MDIFQIWKEIIIAQCNKCKVSQRTGQFSWGLKNEEVALKWFSETTAFHLTLQLVSALKGPINHVYVLRI